MRYSVANIFAIVVLTGIALSLRAFWVSSQDDSFIFSATLIIAVLSGAYAAWIHGRLPVVAGAALVAAITLSSALSLERVFHSSDAIFPRGKIETFYFDDPQLNFMAVVVCSAIATVIGTLAGCLVSRFRNWISINATSLVIIFASAAVCGYTGHRLGSIVFPHVTWAQLPFFSSVLGFLFGIAWVSTNRSFPMRPEKERDAG